MNQDDTKVVAFLLANLIHRLQDSAIRYKAILRAVDPPDDQKVRAILDGPEFVALRSKSIEIRKQVVQAARDQKFDQIPGLLGDLAGELGLAQTDPPMETWTL
jgi:hypothetical protein